MIWKLCEKIDRMSIQEFNLCEIKKLNLILIQKWLKYGYSGGGIFGVSGRRSGQRVLEGFDPIDLF